MQEKSAHLAGAALDIRIWEWLVGLLVIGLIVFVMPIPKLAAIGLVFAAAVVKAVLVVRKYMHLAAEHWPAVAPPHFHVFLGWQSRLTDPVLR